MLNNVGILGDCLKRPVYSDETDRREPESLSDWSNTAVAPAALGVCWHTLLFLLYGGPRTLARLSHGGKR